MATLAGQPFKKTPFLLKVNRDRNRPLERQPLPELQRALATHDRLAAVSTEIRERHGLEALAESPYIAALRVRCAELEAKAAGKPKAAPAVCPVTPVEQLAKLAKRRKAHKREGDRLDSELRELVGKGDVSAREVALALGVTRQRVYQLAPKVAA